MTYEILVLTATGAVKCLQANEMGDTVIIMCNSIMLYIIFELFIFTHNLIYGDIR